MLNLPPSPAEWAWIAGLFEGEGAIHVQANKVTLHIQMNDRDVLETLDELVPSPGGLKAVGPRGSSQPSFIWQLCSRDAVLEMLDEIEPWLHVRRGKQVAEARAALARNRGITRDGPADRPKRCLPDGRFNPDYDRWYYRNVALPRRKAAA